MIVRGVVRGGHGTASKVKGEMFAARCKAAGAELVSGTLNFSVSNIRAAEEALGAHDFETDTGRTRPPLRWWRVILSTKAGVADGKHFVVRHTGSQLAWFEIASDTNFREAGVKDDDWVMVEPVNAERKPLHGHDVWSHKDIEAWVHTQPRWFQTFTWGPKKADSWLVWDTIRNMARWDGKRVLDIGAHTGFFSFAAKRAGAEVRLFEPNETVLARAKAIGNHIECLDIEYTPTDPGGAYDTILYLSVHHQVDAAYSDLRGTLERLKARCHDLFVELISPPISGQAKDDDVNRMVGSEPLLRYKHMVRKTRNIYHLRGHE